MNEWFNKEGLPAKSEELLWQLAEASYQEGSPWTCQQFKEDLAVAHSHYLVLNLPMEGFISYHQVLEEAEICNLAVLPEKKGQGIGKQLLQAMIRSCLAAGVERIFLEVRVSNFPAQALYLRSGFEIIGRRKNYYSHPQEDALIMEKKVRPVSIT
jgi:ribosomal-protein-alanine N-acetyltransferase